MLKIQTVFSVVVLAFILLSCRQNTTPVDQEEEGIKISNTQFTTDSMEIGVAELRTFEQVVKCNGTIVPLPDGNAEVRVPLSGTIVKIRCSDGQSVEKNQVLFEISGVEVIDLQREFAETSLLLKKQKREYERIKSLFDEHVGSEKDFMSAESEYHLCQAKYNGLKHKLDILGLSAAGIENGEFFPSYFIKAPISGNIISFNAKTGNYADPHTTLLEIVDPTKLQLKLFIFYDDLVSLKIGQPVKFKPVNSSSSYTAFLGSIGTEVDHDSRVVDCYAMFKDENSSPRISNLFVEAQIVTQADSVLALPEEAVLGTKKDNYILVLSKKESENYYFVKKSIKTGRLSNGFIEIPEKDSGGKILIKGGYNIIL